MKSHWVMVVMDQCTRRLIGFGVNAGDVDGIALYRWRSKPTHSWRITRNTAVFGMGILKRLSTDNDPLFEYHRWKANLRVLYVEEIKSVPYVPFSHPFVERLIGSIRREYLDQVFFWNIVDLERKLYSFQ